jgi:hypothetical protein
MDNFTYDGKSENLQVVLNLHSHGGKALCYKCNAELLVLPDWVSANKYGKRPGIYCPVNEKHICTWFIFSNQHQEVWRRFEQLQEEQSQQEQQ